MLNNCWKILSLLLSPILTSSNQKVMQLDIYTQKLQLYG